MPSKLLSLFFLLFLSINLCICMNEEKQKEAMEKIIRELTARNLRTGDGASSSAGRRPPSSADLSRIIGEQDSDTPTPGQTVSSADLSRIIAAQGSRTPGHAVSSAHLSRIVGQQSSGTPTPGHSVSSADLSRIIAQTYASSPMTIVNPREPMSRPSSAGVSADHLNRPPRLTRRVSSSNLGGISPRGGASVQGTLLQSRIRTNSEDASEQAIRSARPRLMERAVSLPPISDAAAAAAIAFAAHEHHQMPPQGSSSIVDAPHSVRSSQSVQTTYPAVSTTSSRWHHGESSSGHRAPSNWTSSTTTRGTRSEVPLTPESSQVECVVEFLLLSEIVKTEVFPVRNEQRTWRGWPMARRIFDDFRMQLRKIYAHQMFDFYKVHLGNEGAARAKVQKCFEANQHLVEVDTERNGEYFLSMSKLYAFTRNRLMVPQGAQKQLESLLQCMLTFFAHFHRLENFTRIKRNDADLPAISEEMKAIYSFYKLEENPDFVIQWRGGEHPAERPMIFREADRGFSELQKCKALELKSSNKNIPLKVIDAMELMDYFQNDQFFLKKFPIVGHDFEYKGTEEQKREGVNCTVCLDSFEDGETLKKLPCNHTFHTKCITPWLKSNNHCPICRRRINV